MPEGRNWKSECGLRRAQARQSRKTDLGRGMIRLLNLDLKKTLLMDFEELSGYFVDNGVMLRSGGVSHSCQAKLDRKVSTLPINCVTYQNII